jgi:hypothetical protein
MPDYTLGELREWCLNQKIFHELYALWKQNSYDRSLAPSCDRTDNSKGYSLERLRLMTWEENRANGHSDMRSGKITHGVHPQKAVYQRTFDGHLVNTYVSAADAQRITGIEQGNISLVCRGKRNHAGGYKWNFVK